MYEIFFFPFRLNGQGEFFSSMYLFLNMCGHAKIMGYARGFLSRHTMMPLYSFRMRVCCMIFFFIFQCLDQYVCVRKRTHRWKEMQSATHLYMCVHNAVHTQAFLYAEGTSLHSVGVPWSIK